MSLGEKKKGQNSKSQPGQGSAGNAGANLTCIE